MIPSLYTLILTKYLYICNLISLFKKTRGQQDISAQNKGAEKGSVAFKKNYLFCIDLRFFNNNSTLIDRKSQ